MRISDMIASPASALSVVEDACPDVVLVDLVMPGMDGFAVCKKIRSHTSMFQTPVMMITGIDDEESPRPISCEFTVFTFSSMPLTNS